MLARITDHKLPGGAGGELEGIVLMGSKNTYSSQIEICIVGHPRHKEAIKTHLDAQNTRYQDVETSICYNNYTVSKRSTAYVAPQSSVSTTEASAAAAAATSNYVRLTEEGNDNPK
jgi:4-hydroxy-3-methylbut-2-enyl diphosphate reductase IspH